MEKVVSLLITVIACGLAVFFYWKHHHLTDGLQYQQGTLYNIQRESSIAPSGAVRQYYRWVVEFVDAKGEKQQVVLSDLLTSLRPSSKEIAFYYHPENPERAFLARGAYTLNLVYMFAFLACVGFVAFLAFIFERKGER